MTQQDRGIGRGVHRGRHGDIVLEADRNAVQRPKALTRRPARIGGAGLVQRCGVQLQHAAQPVIQPPDAGQMPERQRFRGHLARRHRLLQIGYIQPHQRRVTTSIDGQRLQRRRKGRKVQRARLTFCR